MTRFRCAGEASPLVRALGAVVRARGVAVVREARAGTFVREARAGTLVRDSGEDSPVPLDGVIGKIAEDTGAENRTGNVARALADFAQ